MTECQNLRRSLRQHSHFLSLICRYMTSLLYFVLKSTRLNEQHCSWRKDLHQQPGPAAKLCKSCRCQVSKSSVFLDFTPSVWRCNHCQLVCPSRRYYVKTWKRWVYELYHLVWKERTFSVCHTHHLEGLPHIWRCTLMPHLPKMMAFYHSLASFCCYVTPTTPSILDCRFHKSGCVVLLTVERGAAAFMKCSDQAFWIARDLKAILAGL